MVKKVMGGNMKVVEENTNLDAVTTETTGSKVDCRWYNRISVFLNCTVNTNTVTVTIQASIDGITWFDLDEKIYSGVTGNDVYHYGYNTYYPYIRTKTSSQTDATVTTFVAARS